MRLESMSLIPYVAACWLKSLSMLLRWAMWPLGRLLIAFFVGQFLKAYNVIFHISDLLDMQSISYLNRARNLSWDIMTQPRSQQIASDCETLLVNTIHARMNLSLTLPIKNSRQYEFRSLWKKTAMGTLKTDAPPQNWIPIPQQTVLCVRVYLAIFLNQNINI